MNARDQGRPDERAAGHIDSTTTLQQATRLMHRDRLHRLVVVEATGRPIAAFSAMDIVALAAEA